MPRHLISDAHEWINEIPTVPIYESLRVGNNLLFSWKRCTELLLRTFFPSVEADHSPLFEGMIGSPPLDRAEIVDSMYQVRSRRSPGLDGMTGEMCKSIWKAIPEYLESIFAKCFEQGYFPAAWKCARVSILLKSPDKCRMNPSSYRGISLLPVLGKALERIMVSRLMEDANEGTSDFQYGFRKGRGVEDAWLHVRRSVSESSDKYALGIFVDFRGAFDYLTWDSVLWRLISVGCRDIPLWMSYFSNRKACVVGAGETVWRDVVRGCPQGSICGPFIWNLMMDTLLASLGQSYKVCAYADDLLIIVEGQSRIVLESKGEEAMRVVCEWGVNAGVEVAREKTVMMMLKGTLSRRPPCIRSGDVSLRYVTQVKYLGIMMRERMNFLFHPAHVKDKLTGVAGKIKRILRSDWGLSRRSVRTIYRGLFVACATFGSCVWYEAAMSTLGRNKVLSCQRIAMLACLPVCRTVSTDALQVLLGAVPLDLEVIRKAITYKIKKGLPLLEYDWISASGRDTQECLELVNDIVIDKWRERWRNSDKGRVTYGFIPDPVFVHDRPDFCFGMNLGFLLTGHGSFNAFLHARNLSETSACDCGSEREDWLHVLIECPLYDDVRSLPDMGIIRAGDGYDFHGSLTDDRAFVELGVFAGVVFDRRRRRVTASRLSPPGGDGGD